MLVEPPFPKLALQPVMDSLLTYGLVEPLTVEAKDAGFVILDGKRRYWAIIRLIQSNTPGWTQQTLIPIEVEEAQQGL